jgi:hypothetical protein
MQESVCCRVKARFPPLEEKMHLYGKKRLDEDSTLSYIQLIAAKRRSRRPRLESPEILLLSVMGVEFGEEPCAEIPLLVGIPPPHTGFVQDPIFRYQTKVAIPCVISAASEQESHIRNGKAIGMPPASK